MSKYIMTESKYNIRLSNNTLLALKLQYEPNIVQKINTIFSRQATRWLVGFGWKGFFSLFLSLKFCDKTP